jgi:hypothetical protein
MLRKTIIALFAVAAVGLVSPSVASAAGGHHGGGGFHGGGVHGGGFRGGGFGGFGLYGPYAYGGYGSPYGYDDYYDGGCYLIRQRVMTPYGWRLRRVQVCG